MRSFVAAPRLLIVWTERRSGAFSVRSFTAQPLLILSQTASLFRHESSRQQARTLPAFTFAQASSFQASLKRRCQSQGSSEISTQRGSSEPKDSRRSDSPLAFSTRKRALRFGATEAGTSTEAHRRPSGRKP